MAAALLLIVGVSFFLYLLADSDYRGEETQWPLGLAALVFVVVGALLVALWTGGHRVGWILSATGLALLISGAAGLQADEGDLVGEAVGGAWLTWFFLVGLLMYGFRPGHPVSPRWRWIAWMGVIGEGFSLTYVVSDQLCVEHGDEACLGMGGQPNRHPEHAKPGKTDPWPN